MPFLPFQFTVITDIPESSLCKALVKITVLSILCASFFNGGGQLHLEDGSLTHSSSRRQILPFQIRTVGTDTLGIKFVTVQLFALNFPCLLVVVVSSF